MKDHKIEEIVRYQPLNRNLNTRVTWRKDSGVFEMYHEESDMRMHFGLPEIPELINVLSDLHQRWEKRNGKAIEEPQSNAEGSESSQEGCRAIAYSG